MQGEAVLLKKDSMPNTVPVFSAPSPVPAQSHAIKLSSLGSVPASPSFCNTISAQEAVPLG